MEKRNNEIIKALECCIKTESMGDCKKLKCPMCTKNGCAYFSGTDADDEHTICHEHFKYALDLINRQKVEIERLKDLNAVLETDNKNANMNLEHITYEFDLLNQEKATVEAKAIKEFAEKLKNFPQKGRIDHHGVSKLAPFIDDADIDNLVKELCT